MTDTGCQSVAWKGGASEESAGRWASVQTQLLGKQSELTMSSALQQGSQKSWIEEREAIVKNETLNWAIAACLHINTEEK